MSERSRVGDDFVASGSVVSELRRDGEHGQGLCIRVLRVVLHVLGEWLWEARLYGGRFYGG